VVPRDQPRLLTDTIVVLLSLSLAGCASTPKTGSTSSQPGSIDSNSVPLAKVKESCAIKLKNAKTGDTKVDAILTRRFEIQNVKFLDITPDFHLLTIESANGERATLTVRSYGEGDCKPQYAEYLGGG
jgi:outer membrane murein-binding lipoprotein Lpp